MSVEEAINKIMLRNAHQAMSEVRAANPGPYISGSSAHTALSMLSEIIEMFRGPKEVPHARD